MAKMIIKYRRLLLTHLDNPITKTNWIEIVLNKNYIKDNVSCPQYNNKALYQTESHLKDSDFLRLVNKQ